MLGKDTELKTIFTIIRKDQYEKLQKIASMRKESKSKVVREVLDDYFSRLMVLGYKL